MRAGLAPEDKLAAVRSLRSDAPSGDPGAVCSPKSATGAMQAGAQPVGWRRSRQSQSDLCPSTGTHCGGLDQATRMHTVCRCMGISGTARLLLLCMLLLLLLLHLRWLWGHMS